MRYGPDRMLEEIVALGYTVSKVQVAQPGGSATLDFAVVPAYEVQLGRFAGRVIGLALPAVPDFPKSVGASLHVRAEPQLLESGSVPNVRNIIASPLGSEWRYWSHDFKWAGELDRSAARLFAQINGIFERA